jgi:hypothetical protein
MNKQHLAVLPLILIMTSAIGCGGTSEEDKVRIDKIDSLEREIHHAMRTLDEKTDELEQAIDDLDTTTVYQ